MSHKRNSDAYSTSYSASSPLRKKLRTAASSPLPRKTTIFKSARELSVLCDVDVALIMYDHGSPNPEVWCSKLGSIDTIINRAYGKTIVPPKPASQVVSQLGVEGLNELVGFLAGKIKQVNEKINLLKSCRNDDKKSTDLMIDHEGMNDDDWINMIDFSTDGLELDFHDDRNDNAIGFCDGGVDDNKVDETKTSDYAFDWFSQLVSYDDDLASLSNLISC